MLEFLKSVLFVGGFLLAVDILSTFVKVIYKANRFFDEQEKLRK